MKISYNWLKQFLQLDWDVEKTSELLTDLGLEVEGVTEFESVKGGLKGIVVGHVLTCIQHPNADRLKLTTVDIGAQSPVQIVCGAPNVAKGQKVPVATIGTTLYTPEGEAWKIKKGKIRGEESHGMICAEDELGLGTNHDGIMVLNNDLKPGTPCIDIFDVENDYTIEIGLTPNRSDAMSHMGVARDLRAGLIQQEVNLELISPSVSTFSVDNRTLKIDVEVEDEKLAPRYCGVTIDNITVQESPAWLQNRLKAIGLSPINNVVDATNYVLHELGQPLHAFDAERIKGKEIQVKTLAKGTAFVTLDGEKRMLHEDDLMICDSEKPMCIAGVFGGEFSGVTENTTSIFLESAYFDPVSIRKTAKRHGLNTDASFRFERGIDINLCKYALKRATILILEIAGGEISSEIVDLFPIKKEDCQVFLTFERINKLIGQEIPRETIKSILTALEIKINNVTESGLGLTVPSYRTDVTREVDVIEEILRVYGYNNIDFKQKFTTSVAPTATIENHSLQNTVAELLISRGYFEIMTNSLTSREIDTSITTNSEEIAVSMLNPLSADLAILRTNTLQSGLEVLRHNSNRKNSDLKLFSFEKTYQKINDKYFEEEHLSLFVTGNLTPETWAYKQQPTDFYYFKGVLETVFEKLGLVNIKQKALDATNIFSEGIELTYKKKRIAQLGLVQKMHSSSFELKSNVLYADIAWKTVLNLVKNNTVLFKDIPKFPVVKRDLALLVDENVSYKEINELAINAEKSLLKSMNLFDVYVGDKLPNGKKSYAVSFTLQDENRTLTDKQIDKTMQKLQKTFEAKLGAELR